MAREPLLRVANVSNKKVEIGNVAIARDASVELAEEALRSEEMVEALASGRVTLGKISSATVERRRLGERVSKDLLSRAGELFISRHNSLKLTLERLASAAEAYSNIRRQALGQIEEAQSIAASTRSLAAASEMFLTPKAEQARVRGLEAELRKLERELGSKLPASQVREKLAKRDELAEAKKRAEASLLTVEGAMEAAHGTRRRAVAEAADFFAAAKPELAGPELEFK